MLIQMQIYTTHWLSQTFACASYVNTRPLLSSTIRSNSGWNSMYRLFCESGSARGARKQEVGSNRVLVSFGRETRGFVAYDVFLDTIRGSGLGQQLGATGLLQGVEQETGLVNGGASCQESSHSHSQSRCPKEFYPRMSDLPVVLKNANHVIRSQSVGDIAPFLSGQNSPAMIFINALLLVELAGIYER